MTSYRLRQRRILVSFGLLCAAFTQGSAQSPKWVTGAFPSRDGVPIRYQAAGEGPMTLVFVHGWSCDRSYWRRQLDHFAASNRVVAIDLGGHGESGLGRDDWTMAAFGEDVSAVVSGLGLDNVVLVGHSMGGVVIVEAARRMPERVRGLVVVDEFNDLDARRTPDQVQRVMSPFAADFPRAVRDHVSRRHFIAQSDPALVEMVANDMATAPPSVGISALANLILWYGESSSRALREVQAPIRAINSDFQPTNLVASARYGVKVDIMSGVGHFVMIEDPEGFNALLAGAIAAFAR